MQLPVRPLLLLAVFTLLGCKDDGDSATSARSPDGVAPPADTPEGRDRTRDRAPEPAMTPACEALVESGELVYESPGFFAAVEDARASADGYVVLLLSEKEAADAPRSSVLRLVRTPEGPVDELLPTDDAPLATGPASGAGGLPPTRAVLALSEPRDGKLLVLTGGGELFGPILVSQIDLATRRVVSTRPLADLSDLPRPHYDAQGAAVGQSVGGVLSMAGHDVRLSASHVALLADGGYAVVGFVADPLPTGGQALGLWLYLFEADGRFRARAEVKPLLSGFVGGVKLAAGASDQLHVLTTVDASERGAFERIHARALRSGPFASLPVVLTFSAAGALTGLREPSLTDCAAPVEALAGALDVVDDAVTFSGTCDGGKRTWVASASTHAAAAEATTVTLAPMQHVSSVLRDAGGNLFVAGSGSSGEAAPDAPVGPGDALLARIVGAGMSDPSCPYQTPRQDAYLLRRTGKPLLVLNYDGGSTQATGDETRGRARVRYFVPEPDAAP